MNTKIIITGAAGFIGSHTVDQLLERGHTVVGVDDLSTGNISNLSGALSNPRFSLIRADICEPGAFDLIVKNHLPDSIIHLAGLVSVVKAQADPGLNFRLNLHSTHLVAEAARMHDVNRIVFASSASVYGDLEELPLSEDLPIEPIGMYGTAKLASEKLLLGYAASYGITAVCLRYFNVFGPRQDPKSPYSGVISIFSDRFKASEPVTIFGSGAQSRDFINVRDVALANTLAATTQGIEPMACNVCTGRVHTLQNLVTAFQKHYPEAPFPVHAEERAGEIMHSCGNPSRARDNFGFEAQVDLDTGLGELIASQEEQAEKAA